MSNIIGAAPSAGLSIGNRNFSNQMPGASRLLCVFVIFEPEILAPIGLNQTRSLTNAACCLFDISFKAVRCKLSAQLLRENTEAQIMNRCQAPSVYLLILRDIT